MSQSGGIIYKIDGTSGVVTNLITGLPSGLLDVVKVGASFYITSGSSILKASPAGIQPYVQCS
jgi:hypothetical protein